MREKDRRLKIVQEIDVLFAEWIGSHGVDSLPSETFPMLFKLLEIMKE